MKSINELRETSPKPNDSIERSNFIFFDIETTGLCVETGAKILEIALISRDTILTDWVRNSKDVSDYNLKNELPLIFKKFKKGVIVGHNVGFDLNFISYKAEKLGLRGPDVFFIDTLSLSKRLIKNTSSYKLESLLDYFDIAIQAQLHTALVDAQATQALFWKLIARGEISTLQEAGMNRLNWTVF